VPEHASFVHGLPSSVQGPVRGVKMQPLTGLQMSVVHSFPSLQTRWMVPGWQFPAASQLSPMVHWSPSLHGVPCGAGVCGRQPATGSQASVWQGLPSLQLRGRPRRQIPAPHFSSPLQMLPSEHGVPSATGVLWQPRFASHESDVQTLASLQVGFSV